MSTYEEYGIYNNEDDIWMATVDLTQIHADRQENMFPSYHGNMSILEDKLFDNYHEAYEYIRNLAGGYCDTAVRFRDTESIDLELPKYLINKDERIKREEKLLSELTANRHFKDHKSNYISCKGCGSKINTEFMRDRNNCPVCRADMRPKSTLERIEKKEELVKRLESELDQELNDFHKKQIDKYPIKWLARITVRC